VCRRLCIPPRSRWAPTGRCAERATATARATRRSAMGKTLTPGGEIRARFGNRRPFGGGKYFRGALVYTTTGDNGSRRDESTIGGPDPCVRRDEPAARPVPTLALRWEMRRLRARASTLPVPRGNVLALGARLERPLNSQSHARSPLRIPSRADASRGPRWSCWAISPDRQ